ncbi:rhodanese [Jiulongibacter sediminis]|uniref:Rhodanese n=2 Tax=Jiulongibacter sediminis TaxID=1605367 RepID=A0A0P7BDN0_9BACT|nr:rhodanese [Jiulongibacter sediminis]TBX25372.1 rhodanese [Jiulongibacter sediminis]
MLFRPLLLMALSMSFFSCQAQVESGAFNLLLKSMLKETVPVISVKELAKKDLNKMTLLDARTKEEFDVSHLKNATWVGYDDFNLSRVKSLDKSKEVVIYCSIGVRSEKIGEKLQEAGFKNVKNLYGSIFEWVNAGNTVYGPDGKPTQKVHAYNKKWGIWLNKGEKVYE